MIAIKNANIITMDKKDMVKKGTILVKGAKLVKIGKQIKIPANARVIEANGKYVLPGLIDAHAHAGLFGEGIGQERYDGNEMTDPVTPHLRAMDGINPCDTAFNDIRQAGVTTLCIAPGSANVMGGSVCSIKLRKTVILEEMILKANAGLKMALGENPKRVYGETRRIMPQTRMAVTGLIRETFTKARNYMDSWDSYMENKNKKSSQPPKRDIKMESLVPVLKKEIPVRIHCHRADDIMTAIRIGEEFDLNIVLEHATEGYKLADVLAKKKIPCVVGPVMTTRGKFEMLGYKVSNAAILSQAGVTVALQTDGTSNVRWLLLQAAIAVREGMDEMEALRSVTINPAKILMENNRIGSIKPGKDADLVIYSGFPLEYKSKVEKVMIDGQFVYSNKEE